MSHNTPSVGWRLFAPVRRRVYVDIDPCLGAFTVGRKSSLIPAPLDLVLLVGLDDNTFFSQPLEFSPFRVFMIALETTRECKLQQGGSPRFIRR